MNHRDEVDLNSEPGHSYANLIVALVIVFVAIRPAVHALHRHFFIEPDSVGYMSLGSNIMHGNGFADFSGTWQSDWPPLYPLAIGLTQSLVHGNAIFALGLVGGICLAATLIIANFWLQRVTASAAIRLTAIILLAFSPPLTILSNSGLSEVLFVPLSLACIYACGKYLAEKQSYLLVIASIFALLACMTRYIGVTVVAALAIAIAISPGASTGRKFKDVLSILLISLLPFCSWCLLNKRFTGTMMGERDPGSNNFHECVSALLSCLQNTLVYPLFSWVLCVGAVIGLVFWLLSRRDDEYPFMRMAPLFVLFYALMIVWSSARYNIDMIDDRLTAPLFVPLLVIAVALIEHLRAALIHSAALVVSVIVSLFFLLVFTQAVQQAQVPDGGYLSSVWQRSSELAFVRTSKFSYPLNSNDSAATWLLGGKVADWVADDDDSPTMAEVESDINALEPPYDIIWLYNAIEPQNFDSNVVATQCNLRIVRSFSDGVIFERTAGNTDSSPP